MTLSRLRLVLGVLGLVGGAALLPLTLDSTHDDAAGAHAALSALVVWSFVASGLVAWARRPANRTGPLMVAVGYAWFLSSLGAANAALPYTIGLLCAFLPLGLTVHLILGYPSGRLRSVTSQAITLVAYVASTVPVFLAVLFLDPQTGSDCEQCPENLALVTANDALARGLLNTANVLGAAVAMATLAVLVYRWRVSTAPARRAMAPVLWAGVLTGLSATALFVAGIVGGQAALVTRLTTFALIACIPLAFLVGLLQLRLQNLSVLGLVRELGVNPAPGRLREALARALGDPSLDLAYWRPEAGGYISARGRPYELPSPGSGRVATVVERDGVRVAVLVHDASLQDRPELVEAVTAAAGLALENEQLQAELRARIEDLRASEARLRALFDSSPLAIVEVDLKGSVTFWNRAAEKLYGWRADEAIGRPLQLVPPARAVQWSESLQAIVDGGGPVDVETTRLRKDGTEIDVALSAAGVPDESGAIVRVMGVAADITERKRAQEALRRERDFVAALLDSAPVLVIVFDREGRFLRFNRECERLTGYGADEVLGRHFWDLFILPEEADSIRAALERVWAGDFPSLNENSWIARDGRERLILWSNSALLDETGNVEVIVSAGLDVTEIRHVEEELRASRARIVEAGDAERRRLERNLHDGAQQRLVALSLALRMAQANVREAPDTAEEMLAAASDELSQAVTELRELARGIHPAVLTDRGLEAAIEALAGRAPTPVELAVELEQRLPAPIEAAAYYVVSEALANVAKYADASLVRVTVGGRNGEALVEVADDGVGGADASRGSGLRGLADRVEALDGTLEVESPAGGGTLVRARLPVSGKG